MHIVVIGVNYKVTPLALREALAFTRERQIALAEKLKNQEVVEENLVVCTCNRTEVYAIGSCVEGVTETVYNILAEEAGIDSNTLTNSSYNYVDIEAIRHLFRVASSLDAMVVGEAQVLGQLKSAYQMAVEYNTAGSYLHKACHAAFRVAKCVRTETAIAILSVSVGTLAVELIEKELGSLTSATILVIGAGEMGELVVNRLKDRGATHIWITNRSSDAALLLAHKVQGVAVPFESWPAHFETADVVITSIGGGVLIKASQIKSAIKNRDGRSFMIMDLAIPRNVEPFKADGVKIYNIDDLQVLAEKNLLQRKEAADKAEAVVKSEAVLVFEELKNIKLAPLLKGIQLRCAGVAKEELEKVFARHPDLIEEEKESIRRCAESIIKKILHDPIKLAKEELAKPGGNGREVENVLHRIFQIDLLEK